MTPLRITPRTRLLIFSGLLYVVLVWALNTVLVKFAIESIDPLTFTLFRFAAMTPLAWLLVIVRRERVRIDRKDMPTLVLCAACGYGVYQYLWVIGLSHTTAFASALLGGTTPIFTLAIVALFGLERVRSGRWLGAIIAFIGIAVFEGALIGRFAIGLGDTLTLLAAVSFASYSVVSGRLLNRYSPVALLAITITIGALMILPGGLWSLRVHGLPTFSPPTFLAYLYSVIFPIILTYPVWFFGISRIGAGRVGLFGFFVPIFAGILSTLILHATIPEYEVVGACVTLGGMAIAQFLGTRSIRPSQRTLPTTR